MSGALVNMYEEWRLIPKETPLPLTPKLAYDGWRVDACEEKSKVVGLIRVICTPCAIDCMFCL